MLGMHCILGHMSFCILTCTGTLILYAHACLTHVSLCVHGMCVLSMCPRVCVHARHMSLCVSVLNVYVCARTCAPVLMCAGLVYNKANTGLCIWAQDGLKVVLSAAHVHMSV